MFKKRERPNSATARQRDDDGEGTSGSVPVADGNKRAKFGASSGSTGDKESGLIGASTKRSETDNVEMMEKKLDDTTLSGIKATGQRGKRPSEDVTRRLEVDAPESEDHRAVLERNAKINEGLKDGTLEKGIYRGKDAYKLYANRSEGAIANARTTGLLGPIRNNMSNVRSTMRVEYWGVSGDGGICKDYKETGYCGYGDSCKFMHDRGDYKQGFHLDREWERKQKMIEEEKKKRWEKKLLKKAKLEAEGKQPGEEESSSSEEEEQDSDDDLPRACPECDTKWEDCSSIPIQTQCGHYFCEDCAMTNYAKTPNCLACQAPTNGIFNSCDQLEEKIKQKKELLAEKKRKKKEARNNRVSWQVHVDT